MVKTLEEYSAALDFNVQHLRNQKILFEAKRENIKLQLEAEYRRRQMVAFQEAKKRLNYLEARDAAARSFQQAHMTNWIVNSVEQQLPSLETSILKKCVQDLKSLSQAKAGSIAF